MNVGLRRIRRVAGRLLRRGHLREIHASMEYALIDPETAKSNSYDGWRDEAVAERQEAAWRPLVEQMYSGQPREDLVGAAEAVRRTGLADPLLLEVGCGSGYYSEILSHLLGHPMRYLGLDYSPAMIRLALGRYPGRPFLVGDATALPFADASVDILLNGVSLMHILNYRAAISESRRVARQWCIFHNVPVLQYRETTILRKRAYGEMTVEVIFNEGELRQLLGATGLAIREVMDSIPYDLRAVLGEPTTTRTYVCEVAQWALA